MQRPGHAPIGVVPSNFQAWRLSAAARSPGARGLRSTSGFFPIPTCHLAAARRVGFWLLAPWRAAAAQPACNPNSEAPTRLPVSATLAKALRPPTTVSLSRWAAPARTCFFRIETVYESVGTRPLQWPTPRQKRGGQGAIGVPAGRDPVPPAILHHAIQGTAVVAAGGRPNGAREALFGGAVTPMSRFIMYLSALSTTLSAIPF